MMLLHVYVATHNLGTLAIDIFLFLFFVTLAILLLRYIPLQDCVDSILTSKICASLCQRFMNTRTMVVLLWSIYCYEMFPDNRTMMYTYV